MLRGQPRYASILAIFMNLILRSAYDGIDVQGSRCELHVNQETNILGMKSSPELCKLKYMCCYYCFHRGAKIRRHKPILVVSESYILKHITIQRVK